MPRACVRDVRHASPPRTEAAHRLAPISIVGLSNGRIAVRCAVRADHHAFPPTELPRCPRLSTVLADSGRELVIDGIMFPDKTLT
jgi:hypothetical protein